MQTLLTGHFVLGQVLNNFFKKGIHFEMKFLRLGFVIFFIFFVTSVSLLFSGPLMIIGFFLTSIFSLLSIASVFNMTIVSAGITSEYILFKKESLNFKNYILGLLLCFAFLLTPFVGVFLIFLLFIYSFGIICDYVYNLYINLGNVA